MNQFKWNLFGYLAPDVMEKGWKMWNSQYLKGESDLQSTMEIYFWDKVNQNSGIKALPTKL